MSIINNIQLPLRRDYIVSGTPSTNWSTNKFIVDNIEIIKNRISSSQSKQFLNITPLIDKEEYEVDIDYYNNINLVDNNTPQIFDGEIGKELFVDTRVYTGDTLITATQDYYFVTDSYRDYTNNPILVNGNKRYYTKGKGMLIPFIAPLVIDIQIEGVVTTVNNRWDSSEDEEQICYYYLPPTFLNNKSKLILNFRDFNNILGTIYLYPRVKETCIYKDVDVIFKNSYGVVEELRMNGRSNDSLKSDSESFKRSNIDINGNPQPTNKHINKILNKTGYRTWKLNTGNALQFMNDAYEDLLYSEEVWLRVEGKIIPVIFNQSNFDKELDTDGIINYTFEFKEDKKINE